MVAGITTLRRAGYLLLLSGFGAAIWALRFGPEWALLPIAVIFGWSQLSGL
jgi:hypothetical protein